MLEEAIIGDEVIVLTKAGSGETFDLLDDENMMKLKMMPQKNIAANILMRAMRDKVEQIKKKNIYCDYQSGQQVICGIVEKLQRMQLAKNREVKLTLVQDVEKQAQKKFR